jgi:hypothetical protein
MPLLTPKKPIQVIVMKLRDTRVLQLVVLYHEKQEVEGDFVEGLRQGVQVSAYWSFLRVTLLGTLSKPFLHLVGQVNLD